MNNVLQRMPQFRLFITGEGQLSPRYTWYQFSPDCHYRVAVPDEHYQVDIAKKGTDGSPDVPKTPLVINGGGNGYLQSLN
ncbi:MAG: hypothetical protein NTV68_08480 [Methanomicrobiales archaeon]|nr:hypothetical protein [Methanomicrobiales archaeon]